jgi:AcrR family transcriptional regulator
MTEISTQSESEKREQIISVARSLFAQLGWEKVTMNDIAQHVGTSKASLYYYFTDKESLFRAVVDREQQEFLQEINRLLSRNRSACWQLEHYAELRHRLFQHLLILGKLRGATLAGMKPLFKELLAGLREHELEAIEQILTRGNERGDFKVADVATMADLFLNVMQGLRMRYTGVLQFGEEEQEALRREQMLFVRVFTNGLRKNQ